ncbi:MAG TPA: hypothetical protein VK700_15730 [Steroidobacteraceae bacterium]|nr:hypothetical protein [Steroidobacteraceae bacterium]
MSNANSPAAPGYQSPIEERVCHRPHRALPGRNCTLKKPIGRFDEELRAEAVPGRALDRGAESDHRVTDLDVTMGNRLIF